MINLAYNGAARSLVLRTPTGGNARPTVESELVSLLSQTLRQKLRPPGPEPRVHAFATMLDLYIHIPASATLEPTFAIWWQQVEAELSAKAEELGLKLQLSTSPYDR